MKKLYIISILLLYYFSAIAQVTFDHLPRDLQLYPRDANSLAQVVISGRVSVSGYTKIGLQMLREGVLTKIISQTLAPTISNTPFSFSSTIKAEPAEYSFQVFLYKGFDSTMVAERKRIVCGDAYIIHGQSNALAVTNLELYTTNFDDKFMRNVAIPFNGAPADISWYIASEPFASVGGIGLTLQRLILENYGIPTCVINGAMGGATIDFLSARTPNDHADPNTAYGNLLYKAQWAGLARQVKAIIWKQGEAEAGNESPGYAQKFTQLYNQFREDYGEMRLYVGQINILAIPQDSAAALRDYQRRTKYLFKNVETIATVGTPGYGGVHYTGQANQQLGAEQFRQIARDVYGSVDTLQINSPDIKKVFYNAQKDAITLVFDDQMKMNWTNDTTFYSFATGAVSSHFEQKDYFYLDKQAGFVASGSAAGNRVMLKLKQPVSAKTIRYLPAFFGDYESNFYQGPTLRNTRGMRAFSFDGILIADALSPITTLTAKPISEKQVDLNWTPSVTAQIQLLERADGTPTNFNQIASLAGTKGSYMDTSIPDAFETYYYRLRAYSATSESLYSNVISARPLILGLEPLEAVMQVYPNPVTMGQTLHISVDQMTFTRMQMRNQLGQLVKSWHGVSKNQLSINLDNLETGLYIAELQTNDGYIFRRKVLLK